MANQKIAAVLVNNTDADITLPLFYHCKADEDAKKNGQKITLNAAADRGVVGRSPEVGVTSYALNRLKSHPILVGLARAGNLSFRSPNLVIELGT